ncbi:MFS transporter, CP family, cyanate transporter [Methylobacillus rhizosphaerae]|uniref:MFS transporter, CP family, cyanate transporter n=1 Tax=Methylobacillus rhizosphaerae TaxID=551994 RepID=A0A238YZ42_9PROT|nr:MFS transporter [Methylobacillus rhizosphaerae]SNR75944.1 MFS transporter, CP family, cyanate transporter [Methylobacillus rhizosphaerae]
MANFSAESSKLSSSSPTASIQHPVFPASGVSVGFAIAAIILVAIALRPGIVSMGPLLPAIIDTFQLSHSTASLLTTIPDLLMGLLALPTPWLARRYGRDPVLLLALLLLCIAIAVRAFANSVDVLLLATAGVGAGIAVAGALIAGYIKGNFPHKAALVMGIYATALSFGSTLSAAVSGPIAMHYESGWRMGAGIWSALAALAVMAWWLLARREKGLVIAQSRPAALPWRNRTAWLIALFFAADNFLFYAVLSWTAPMYIEYGLDTATAGFILATFTTVFMISNPILGAISRSTDRRVLLAACAMMAVIGLAWMALLPTSLPFLSIALCAFGLGGAFTLGMTLPLDNTHSVDEANAWNAFVLTVGYLIAAAGPLSVGVLRDCMQDFHLARWLLVLMAFVMLAITPLLKPHQAH